MKIIPNQYDGKGLHGGDYTSLLEKKAGFKPNQRRDKTGKWTDDGGDVPEYSNIDPKKVVDTHIKNYNEKYDSYGSTFDPISGENLSGKPFFSVALHPKAERVIKSANQLKASQVIQLLKENEDLLSTGNYGLGSWFSQSDGGLFLEVTELVSNYDDAVKLAEKNNQIGIFDLKTGTFIPTGGTGEKGLKNWSEEWHKFMRAVHRKDIEKFKKKK